MDRKQLITGLVCAVLGIAVIVGIIIHHRGWKDPHNLQIAGVVDDETELYGNVLTGYATAHEGSIATLERWIHDLSRPGPPMKLYHVRFTNVSYDTMEWFKTTHHTFSAPSEVPKEHRELLPLPPDMAFIQTEGDKADKGQTFEAVGSLLVPSPTFLVRGIRYVHKDKDGKEQVTMLHYIIKDWGVEFK